MTSQTNRSTAPAPSSDTSRSVPTRSQAAAKRATVPALSILALAGAALLSLAACSSSGGGSVSAPPAGIPAVSSAAALTSTGVTTGGKQVDPCAVITPAQVQPLQTDKLGKTQAVTQPVLGSSPIHSCTYHTANGDTGITVDVYVGSQASNLYAQDRRSRGTPTAVPGVGQQAVHGDEDPDVSAISGDTLCTVEVADPGTVPGAARLYDENGHHTDIGAPAFDTIAAALGTLCNRIFGAGNTTPNLAPLATDSAAPPSDAGAFPSMPQFPSGLTTS